VAATTDMRESHHHADSALDVSPAEIEHLRSALYGDWVELLISLWPSWGFCPRHGVGFAIVEMELQDRLFSTSILYKHFVEGAAEIASARLRTWRGIRLYLRPRADCFICGRLSSDDPVGREQGRDWRALAEHVNQRRRIHEQVDEARQEWARHACPVCVAGGGGIVCRPHLLAGAKQEDLAPALAALSARLRRFVGSMTAAKTETTLHDRFSWVETLGWFGGWSHAEKLMLERSGGEDKR
jgi:hypothetical protein